MEHQSSALPQAKTSKRYTRAKGPQQRLGIPDLPLPNREVSAWAVEFIEFVTETASPYEGRGVIRAVGGAVSRW